MCLQEVQADHFENFLEPELAKYNYAGVHKCKTREFMGQYGKMDGCAILYRRDKFTIVPGGVHDVEFNAIARSRHSSDKRILNRLLKDNVAQVLLLLLGLTETYFVKLPRLTRGRHVAWVVLEFVAPNLLTNLLKLTRSRRTCAPTDLTQVVLLEMVAPHPATRRQLVVANTHINASPEFADVKLWQTQVII